MNRKLIVAALALATSACSFVSPALHHGSKNPYERPIFYTTYLDPADQLDQRIHQDLVSLRADPGSAPMHNDLGQLLAAKGFPKDAEVEFGRAVESDSHFYPAWYNLGLMRVSRGDGHGARYAFGRALHYRPGYSEALFQMGLLEEQSYNDSAAIDYYVRAFLLNRDLLNPQLNPRIVDSKLVDVALVQAYPKAHARESMQFLSAPSDYGRKRYAPPAVDPGQQPPAATAPASGPPPPGR